MPKQCRICQVPLEGARELDEGNGDICLRCLPYEDARAVVKPLLKDIEVLHKGVADLFQRISVLEERALQTNTSYRLEYTAADVIALKGDIRS